MSELRQSFTWWSFADPSLDPDALLRAAAETGYAAVELIGPEHWDRARAHGLAVAAINGHASIEEGLNRREHHDRIERELEANLRRAERWGIANLICFSGNRAGIADAEGAQVTAESLRRVAPLAESAGVTLVLELLNSKVDHPDYQCDRTAWGASVVDLVGSPRVKLLYDVYHMQIMEGDLIRTFREHAARIGHVHTAGNPGRREIGGAQEIHYPAVFRAIRDAGYGGFVAHEFRPSGDPAAALRGAFATLEASLREA